MEIGLTPKKELIFSKTQRFETEMNFRQLLMQKNITLEENVFKLLGIHEATKGVKLLTKKISFQLPLFLQTAPEEIVPVSTILSIRCFITGKNGV